MTTTKIVATLLGLGAIAWVNYWFFWVSHTRTKGVTAGGTAG